MCEKSRHEVVCPGVILCRQNKTLRVWMSRLRAILGIRYADMSTAAIVSPIVAAALDAYTPDELQVIEIILPSSHIKFPVVEAWDNG